MRDALLRMIQAARKASTVSNALSGIGYPDTPCADIFGDVADAIYYLIGENTDEFMQSVTFFALTDENMHDNNRVDLLLSVYEKNTAR